MKKLGKVSTVPEEVEKEKLTGYVRGTAPKSVWLLLWELSNILIIFAGFAAIVVECIRLARYLALPVYAGLLFAAVIIALILFIISRQVFRS